MCGRIAVIALGTLFLLTACEGGPIQGACEPETPESCVKNLLENGDFTEDVDGWYPDRLETWLEHTMEHPSDEGSVGSLLLTNVDYSSEYTTYRGVEQCVAVEAGDYIVAANVRIADDIPPGSDIAVTAQAFHDDGCQLEDDAYLMYGQRDAGTEDWQHLSRIFAVPEDYHGVRIRLVVFKPPKAEDAAAQFDNVLFGVYEPPGSGGEQNEAGAGTYR